MKSQIHKAGPVSDLSLNDAQSKALLTWAGEGQTTAANMLLQQAALVPLITHV
jgi:hypothetical protein